MREPLRTHSSTSLVKRTEKNKILTKSFEQKAIIEFWTRTYDWTETRKQKNGVWRKKTKLVFEEKHESRCLERKWRPIFEQKNRIISFFNFVFFFFNKRVSKKIVRSNFILDRLFNVLIIRTASAFCVVYLDIQCWYKGLNVTVL